MGIGVGNGTECGEIITWWRDSWEGRSQQRLGGLLDFLTGLELPQKKLGSKKYAVDTYT